MLRAFSGEVSPRELRVMVEHLPPDNPVAREIRKSAWDDPTYILWDVDAQLRVLTAQIYNITRDKGAPALEPTFLPHPGDEGKTQQTKRGELTAKQVAERAFLEEILNREIPKR